MLRRRSSRDVLRSLIDGDPLDLERLCSHRLETEAWLVDMTDLVLMTAARVAHDGSSGPRNETLHAWLDERVRMALRSELEREFQDECRGRPVPSEPQVRFLFLAGLIGIDPALGRRACVAFNALPFEERRTFWALRIDQHSVEHHAATWNEPPDLVRARLRRVVEVLVQAGHSNATGSGEP